MPGQDPNDPFQQLVAEKMTRERAERIRHLRVKDGYTWRKIGQVTWQEWGERGTGDTYDIGYALCVVAADMLGEDATDGVWNEPPMQYDESWTPALKIPLR